MNATQARANWIGVDWGTSRMRVFAFDGADRLIDRRGDGPGMNGLERQAFEAALLSQISPFRQPGCAVPVTICGMVGSRQGWHEVPYLDLPVSILSVAHEALPVETNDPLLDIRIVPGLAWRNPSSPDVVRGEETQLLGLVGAEMVSNALVCLPGTHSKWLTVNGGRAVASHTFMTGELFDLIAHRSVLRHSVGEDFDETAFLDGVRKAASEPSRVLTDLFRLRASDLLFGSDPTATSSHLSGLLIGMELSEALPGAGAEAVFVIGSQPLADRYRTAAGELGQTVEVRDGDEMVIQGLIMVHHARNRQAQVAS